MHYKCYSNQSNVRDIQTVLAAAAYRLDHTIWSCQYGITYTEHNMFAFGSNFVVDFIRCNSLNKRSPTNAAPPLH